MLKTERVAIEERMERRTLDTSMRQVLCLTRGFSPRQLPTDHDYAVSTRGYQSDQPSQKLLDRLLALSSTSNAYREQGKEMQTRLSLLTTGFQNGPRGKGYASPRQKRARP